MKKGLERKLYFYDFNVYSNGNKLDLFKLFKDYNDNKFKGDYKDLEKRNILYNQKKDGKYYFLALKSIDSVKAECVIYSLRYEAFPYLFNLINGKDSMISNNSKDTLMEQTHFSIFFSNNIIICEYNHNGPRVSSLKYILGNIYDSITQADILPILLPEEYRNFEKVKSIDYLSLRVGMPGTSILTKLADLPINFDLDGVFSNCEELQVDIKISSCKRTSVQLARNSKLLNKLKNLAQRKSQAELTDSNNIVNELKQISLKTSIDNDSKSLPINLLEDKLLHSVTIPKLTGTNSKYIDSREIFKAIDDAYKNMYLKIYGDKNKVAEEIATSSDPY